MAQRPRQVDRDLRPAGVRDREGYAGVVIERKQPRVDPVDVLVLLHHVMNKAVVFEPRQDAADRRSSVHSTSPED